MKGLGGRDLGHIVMEFRRRRRWSGEEGHVVLFDAAARRCCSLSSAAWQRGKEEENFCREAEKPQWRFKVAARHGRGAGGALSGVEGDLG